MEFEEHDFLHVIKSSGIFINLNVKLYHKRLQFRMKL